MEFRLSDDQLQFSDTLKRYLDKNAPVKRTLNVIESAAIDDDLWNGLGELGLSSMLVPEEAGGLNGTALDAVVLAETLASAAAPVPYLGAAILAPAAMQIISRGSGTASWLGRIAEGKVRIALAGIDDPSQVDLRLAGTSISGSVRNIFEGAAATHLLCCRQDAPAFIVDRGSAGVSVHIRPSLDGTRKFAEWSFDNCEAEFSKAGLTATDHENLTSLARVALAADSLGSAQSLLDRAVEYAKERKQFGRAIAGFQSIKHLCADMVTALEPCRALVWYAAYALDTSLDDRHVAAAHAKAHVSEVARDVAYNAILVHGAIGFTDALGLHLWFKRIATNRQVFGSPEACRREAAMAQGLLCSLPQAPGA